MVVRGHLELSGVVTAEVLTEITSLPPGRVAYGLTALEREGFALRGHYRDPDGIVEEWVARRLLARMHSYSRRARRDQVETATAQDYLRFLLRWQHLAPGTQLVGDDGLRRIVEQLQGWEAPAAAWEPELLARRLRQYEPGLLDRLCHEGEVGWLRLAPPPRDPDAPAGAPNRATPVSVVLRDDLAWLLAAARPAAPAEPVVGATAEVLDALRTRGASFANELGHELRRLPEDLDRALWDGVARGLLTADGFSAIRARVDRAARGNGGPGRVAACAVRVAIVRRRAVGRWSKRWRATSMPTSWPRPSPSSSCIAGALCSATWCDASRGRCSGVMSNARCAGSKIVVWCVAGGS